MAVALSDPGVADGVELLEVRPCSRCFRITAKNIYISQLARFELTTCLILRAPRYWQLSVLLSFSHSDMSRDFDCCQP